MSALPVLLTVGVDEQICKMYEDSLKHAQVTSIPFDLEKIMEEMNPPPVIILATAPSVGASVEVAQALRMQYPHAALYFFTSEKNGFERKDFIKNGFTDAFLLPIDTTTLRVALNEAIAKAGSEAIQVYRSVKLLDIEGGEALDFDTSIYLPANNKYVKITHAGDSIEGAKLEKIKKNKVNNLHVPAAQIHKFYDYSAKQLQKIGSSTAMSATERRDKLTSSVRDLLSGMFSEELGSFQSGKDVMNNCSGIITSYIVQQGDSEWYTRIQQLLGEQGDSYSHSGNVSTLAAMFSLGLGIGKPEDMALAGLLHDIGKALLPGEIQLLDAEDMTPEQHKEYQKHPLLSVNLIKQKKLVVPDIVTKMILQHHELFNGTGFPAALFGDRICKEAQLLALADKFDHLTKLKPGRPLITPSEAIKIMRTSQVNDPSLIQFDPALLMDLLALFPG